MLDLKCQACGVEVEMPFVCSFCGGAFCPQHRLPESHDRPEYWRVRARREPAVRVIVPPDIRAYAGPVWTGHPIFGSDKENCLAKAPAKLVASHH